MGSSVNGQSLESGDKVMNKIIICDLDGTLSNCQHRMQFLKRKDWDSFNEKCKEDRCNENVANIIRNLKNRFTEIYIVTGRSDKYKEETKEWLFLNDISYNKLFMRNAEDKRSDKDVKEEILEKHIDKSSVWFVIDDRDTVVEMWRENGLCCLQAQEG
jgi:hydroxymethylpyrimidine pyrophosphatase-like HAD family hydrolase